MKRIIEGLPAEWSQYTRVIGPMPARTAARGSASRRIRDDELCACDSCVAFQPWRAALRKERRQSVERLKTRRIA